MCSSACPLCPGRKSPLGLTATYVHACRRIPDRELEVRKDLRGERVFTIDPDTAKDLDDALSGYPKPEEVVDESHCYQLSMP